MRRGLTQREATGTCAVVTLRGPQKMLHCRPMTLLWLWIPCPSKSASERMYRETSRRSCSQRALRLQLGDLLLLMPLRRRLPSPVPRKRPLPSLRRFQRERVQAEVTVMATLMETARAVMMKQQRPLLPARVVPAYSREALMSPPWSLCDRSGGFRRDVHPQSAL